MTLRDLRDTPPWDWPEGTSGRFRQLLADPRASASDRLIAAELAGQVTVMNNALAEVLTAIIGNAAEPEELRATAAIALGPVLELADMHGFDDPEDVPITEGAFRNIQESLKKQYFDEGTPKLVRRRILEGSVRAPEPWHNDAIRAAYASGDEEWMLTAVFGMRWVRGFDKEILSALKSSNTEIRCEAVQAAGTWEVGGAWDQIVQLVNKPGTPKSLLLAAIGAVVDMRPAEAPDVLAELADSDDEEISEAVEEAMLMADPYAGEEEDEGDMGGEWIN